MNGQKNAPLADKQLVSDVVEHELARHPTLLGSWSALARVCGMSRNTLNRMRSPATWDATDQRTYRRIETALGLPFDALTAVAVHDIVSLEEDGASKDLVRFLYKRLAKQSEQGGMTKHA